MALSASSLSTRAWYDEVPIAAWVGLAAALIAAQALTLHFMGRVTECRCGSVRFWTGVVKSSENSQQLTDWYTFTHILHGFGFYVLVWLVGRRWPVGLRFLTAVLLESSWEVIENTDFVINRYRAATISLDYYGDSVINSVCDTLAMAAGFWTAARLPLWLVLVVAVGIEVVLAYVIRDNLTLNLIMLLHPIDAIRTWQMGI